MYCRNCGQKLADGDKFCSSCGAKTILADENNKADGISSSAGTAESQPQVDNAAETKEPLFEPFDFKSFDFLDSDPAKNVEPEEKKVTPPSEEFDWNIHTFPGMGVEKTEDIDFNWSMTPEEVDAEEKMHEKASLRESAAPEVFTSEERTWTSSQDMAEIKGGGAENAPQSNEKTASSSLEEELFGNLDSKTDEARKQSEEIDKFFTFHKKNEEFQKLLDQEYEKIKSGNILSEEMNTAEAVSEEKFASRTPEDPMEELFASEGIVKGYEPKPVESDVLERIEAAEAEKKAREEAAKLIEEEKRKAKEEAERKVREEAEELAKAQAAEEAARRRLDEEAKRLADARAAQEAAERELERAVARGEQIEEEFSNTIPEAEPVETVDSVAFPQEAEAEPEDTKQGGIPAAEEEEQPIKTKPVDKAAILAGMATASEMVQRDRAYAAAEAAAKASEQAEPVPEPDPIELPDFLGHLEDTEQPEQDLQAEAISETSEPETEELLTAVEAEPEEVVEAVEAVETLEDLQDIAVPEAEPEKMAEDLQEVPAELFSVEDLLSDEQQAEPAETAASEDVTDATLIMNEDTVAQILTEQEPSKTVSDETMVFPADYNPAEDISEAIEEEKTDGQEKAEIRFAELDDEDEDEEYEKGGKGRIVLKVCLVILIILLVMEIAGVVIKIAAPSSGAAKFIDNQLNNVIHLFTGDEDAEYAVFANTEDIRNEPMENKTELIKAEMGKNKDGNIQTVEYNKDLKFDPNTEYENTDIQLTQTLSDVTWYKDAQNKQVYYDQALVGTIIAYDSQKVNLMNHNDRSVLNLMKKGTDLYKEVKKAGGNENITFEKLQIGEIRQAGNSYFVWVSEKIQNSQDGNGTTEKIYEIEPDGETMKVVNSYEL